MQLSRTAMHFSGTAIHFSGMTIFLSGEGIFLSGAVIFIEISAQKCLPVWAQEHPLQMSKILQTQFSICAASQIGLASYLETNWLKDT